MPPPGRETSRFAAAACSQYKRDGLVLLGDSDVADFRMWYFNADGSEDAMCGNGACCAGALARKLGHPRDTMLLETLSGLYPLHILPGRTRVHFQQIGEVSNICLSNGQPVWIIDTGVTHALIPVDDTSTIDVDGIGRSIRNDSTISRMRPNVNFVSKREDGISIRVYECGVEAETAACGTGAVAAAAFCGGDGLVKVYSSGGDCLLVQVNGRSAVLEGPAAIEPLLQRMPA